MRKVAVVAMAVALLVFAGGPASAAGNLGYGLTGGAAVPTGDFSDGFDTGFNFGGYGEFWFNDQGAIGIDVAYNRHSAKDETNNLFNALRESRSLAEGATTADADLEVTASSLQVGVHGKWAPPAQAVVRPYVQVGLGVYSGRLDWEGSLVADGVTSEVDGGESESDLGVNVGAGMLFEVSPSMSIGVTGAFHNVFSEDDFTQFFVIGAQAHFMTGAR